MQPDFAFAQFLKGYDFFQAGKYCDAKREWLSSVQLDDSTSPFGLGEIYARGLCAEKNDRLASRWYLTAALRGHARARAELGYRYASGKGVKVNLPRAYFWLSASRVTAGGWESEFLSVVNQNIALIEKYLPESEKKKINMTLERYRKDFRVPSDFESLE